MDSQELRAIEEKESLERYQRLEQKRKDFLLKAQEHRMKQLECEQKARSIAQTLREMDIIP